MERVCLLPSRPAGLPPCPFFRNLVHGKGTRTMGMIAVLGAGGQLGTDLLGVLGADAIALPRDADLTCPEVLRRALEAQSPAIVINCAAYNFVDRAESEPEAAFAVN